MEFQVPEDECLEELEDSQCLSDDTDTEAASEVGIPWDHPTPAAAFGVGKADFKSCGVSTKKNPKKVAEWSYINTQVWLNKVFNKVFNEILIPCGPVDGNLEDCP